MIKINLVVVGKVKEKYFSQAVEEYLKRLSRFCEIKVFEVGEENFKNATEGNIRVIVEKEGQNILPHLKGYVFIMAIEGKKFSSESFADKLSSLISSGNGVFTFVIGGSYGVSDVVKKKANELISFSDMTFPHTLFRVMLTEQLYRAFSIMEGSAYHK